MRVLAGLFIILALFAASTFFNAGKIVAGESLLTQGEDIMDERPEDFNSIVLAGGCFWCVESEYRALNGVLHTRVGYMGGKTDNPSYRDITTGKTGHAEVVEVTYDPSKITHEELLEFFLTQAHDPTQLNKQGVDVGTQYRSAIFYADDTEKEIAQKVIDRINQSRKFNKAIVTTLEPLSTFWLAEEYHQQYYEKYQQQNGRDHIRVILKKAGR